MHVCEEEKVCTCVKRRRCVYVCEEEKMYMRVKRRRCLFGGRGEVSCEPLTKLSPENFVEKMMALR